MNNIEKYNNELSEIWTNYNKNFPQYTKYIPEYIYRDLNENTILFIGLNPSMNIKWWNEKLKESKFQIKAEKLFLWKNINTYANTIKKAYYRIKPFNNYQGYFGPFKTFAKDCKFSNFEHLDILFFRESNQKKIKDNIKFKNGEIKYKDPNRKKYSRKNSDKFENFIKRQVKITKEIALNLNPKIICVFNAFASRIVETSWKLDNISGIPAHWTINTSKGKKIPVILGPMLSNAQMDIYTKQRLKKDIIHILEQY